MARVEHKIYLLKEAAARVGVHEDSLTRAERLGRVPSARRDELGHRVYDEHDIDLLRALMRR